MISIVVCSVKSALRTALSENIRQTIGITDVEIIIIENEVEKHSITKAYNIGAAKAKYPYLCFCHEDILFHTPDWGLKLAEHLADQTISLIGVLGSLIKTRVPSGVYIPIKKLNRVNQLQRKINGGTDHYYENPLHEHRSEVSIVDGMFLATTKSNHAAYPFDEKLLTGFHGYDIDYSLGQSRNGKIVVVYDILIEHFSYGGNTIQWINEQLKVTDKWNQQLPEYTSLRRNELLEAEIKNTDIFLITLFVHNYKKTVQLKYLLHLLRIDPFRLRSLYLIRKFLVYGKFEEWIKRRIIPLN